MRRTCAVLTVIAALLAGLVQVWAKAVSRTPPEEKVPQRQGWSAALVDLINDPARVDGYWFEGNNHYYYAGDAKALNRFLEQYAGLPDTPLRLVLHPGRGQVPVNVPKWPKTQFDWQLTLINPPTRSGIVPRGYKPPPPAVAVEVYVGGTVGLADLDVPLAVNIESGGEIEEFIAHHQAKQSLPPRGHEVPAGDDTPPKGAPAPSADSPAPPASAK